MGTIPISLKNDVVAFVRVVKHNIESNFFPVVGDRRGGFLDHDSPERRFGFSNGVRLTSEPGPSVVPPSMTPVRAVGA